MSLVLTMQRNGGKGGGVGKVSSYQIEDVFSYQRNKRGRGGLVLYFFNEEGGLL